MTIKERLALLKAGYSKDEINTMIDEDKAPAAEPSAEESENAPAPAADFMAVVSALAEEVKGMKKAMQQENLKNAEIDGQQSRQDQLDDILRSIINPTEEKKE